MNFLTIVLDSCRFDSFERAHVPNIRSHFEIIEGGAIATFTYPAHAAMFQGFFPNCRADRPLYNRFARKSPDAGRSLLIDIYTGDRSAADPVVTVPNGFRRAGFSTSAIGGVSWFRFENPMSHGFENFLFVPSARKAVQSLKQSIEREPFYAVLNLGETHRPYNCPWTADQAIESPLSGTCYDSVYKPELHSKQIRALEYLDTVLEEVFEWASGHGPTLVCLCADHGETFGEDGCFGHGFYHPSVMSVPVGWSLFIDGSSIPVDWPVLERLKDLSCGRR